MKKPLIAFLCAIAAGALIVTVLIITRQSDDDSASDPNSSIAIANSFPVPEGASVAFPDSVTHEVATKGWRATGTVNQACGAWRDAYRNWIEKGDAGSITGEDEDGRRCTLSGPKSGHIADLAITVYGQDTTPQVTLTVRKAPR